MFFLEKKSESGSTIMISVCVCVMRDMIVRSAKRSCYSRDSCVFPKYSIEQCIFMHLVFLLYATVAL